jgi:hypothetical protein
MARDLANTDRLRYSNNGWDFPEEDVEWVLLSSAIMPWGYGNPGRKEFNRFLGLNQWMPSRRGVSHTPYRWNPLNPKILGVTEYAGGAQAMRPYPAYSTGDLGTWQTLKPPFHHFDRPTPIKT